MKYAIIMSAGFGTRMKSELPKGAVELSGKPLIRYTYDCIKPMNFDKVVVVVGYKKEVIMDLLKGEDVSFSVQEELNGTAKAVDAASSVLGNLEGETIILPCDMPLLSEKFIESAFNYHNNNKNDLTVVSSIVDNPYSFGRIVRSDSGLVKCIKEELDATPIEKEIKEINSSVYIVNNRLLFDALKKVNNNNKKHEYYLTDIVSIAINEGKKVDAFIYDNPVEVMGINDICALTEAEKLLNNK